MMAKGYSLRGSPRKIITPAEAADRQVELQLLAERVSYCGNPSHKRNPGDFNLTPPAQPREGKTLCDGVGIFCHAVAEALLRRGVRRGLVSSRQRNGWPRIIWAVAEDGSPLEAKLDNDVKGQYHGFPLQVNDAMWPVITERWGGE